MKLRGLSLLGYVGRHRQKDGLLEVHHATMVNLEDGLRKLFSCTNALKPDATKEEIAEAFGECARVSLLAALEHENQ